MQYIFDIYMYMFVMYDLFYFIMNECAHKSEKVTYSNEIKVCIYYV